MHQPENSTSRSKLSPAIHTTAIAAALLLLSLLIFRDFIFGEKILLYKDAGSDSINDYYPWFAHLSDYLRNTGLPSWSFFVGMGQPIYYAIGYLILDPVVWLPKAWIAHALVYQHLCKILVAGLILLRFFRLRGLSFCAAAVGSLLVSLSAYMSIGSCWPVFADEVVCFSFLLLAIEETITGDRWVYLPIAVVVTSLITVFHLYLCAVLLLLYVPARLLELYGWKPLDLIKSASRIAAFALLGLGLATFIWLPSTHVLFNTPRVSGAIRNSWPTPALFHFESVRHCLTALLRLFSNDILGTGDEFRGGWNYLEAPITYVGLLSLLLFPQIFVRASLRQRLIYFGLLLFMVVPVLIPWFRSTFWLFEGGYYRTFSLFCILGLATSSMTVFSSYASGHPFNVWVLVASLLVLLSALYLPIESISTMIDSELRLAATVFLIGYGILLVSGQSMKRQQASAWIIAVLAAIELAYFDHITVARHPTVTKSELMERVGYNDETIDAIRDLHVADKSFFRIRKTWGSGPAIYPSYNDAMVFGFYGTASYSSFNNLNYITFLMAVDAIRKEDVVINSIWSTGLLAYPLLSTFTCEKYVITKEPAPFEQDTYYEFVKRYGNVYLFRNQLFLPLGLTYSKYLTEDNFRELPSSIKPIVLLNAVVLSDKDAATAKIASQLAVTELLRDSSESMLETAVAERRSTALQVQSFSQDHINGTVRVDEERMLVLQTPFDTGWRARIDQRPAKTFRVNAGLLGVEVPKGEHVIDLYYKVPLLSIGIFISFVSCGILFAALWRQSRSLSTKHKLVSEQLT